MYHEYRPWLEGLGFEVDRLQLLPRDMVHKGKNDLAAWLRNTWLPYTQKVPQPPNAEFKREIVAAHARIGPPETDGSIHPTMVRLEVQVAKGRA